MNSVKLSGRLARDPEVRYTQGPDMRAVARYAIAVDRDYKDKDGNRPADFFNVVAFGKIAEFAEKYLSKGMKIILEGRLQSGSYTNKDGQKVYYTEVLAERHEFCESKKDREDRQQAPSPSYGDPYQGSFADQVPEGFSRMTDDDIPF